MCLYYLAKEYETEVWSQSHDVLGGQAMAGLDGIIEMAGIGLLYLVPNVTSQSGAPALFVRVFLSACEGERKSVSQWGGGQHFPQMDHS